MLPPIWFPIAWIHSPKFSPSENEKLAYIHDYLTRVVSPDKDLKGISTCFTTVLLSLVFNDIAEHEVGWRDCAVEYGEAVEVGHIQHTP
jgi:hypothetical protein